MRILLLTFATVLLLTSSCQLTKQERQLNRGTKKLEKLFDKYPGLRENRDTTVVLDTTIAGIDTIGVVFSDTAAVDSLTSTAANKIDSILTLHDTITITDIRRIIRQIPMVILSDTIKVDSAHTHLRIWQNGNSLGYSLVTDSIVVSDSTKVSTQTIKPVTIIKQTPFYKNWFFYAFMVSMGVILLMTLYAIKK